jgi:hypothetical protein
MRRNVTGLVAVTGESKIGNGRWDMACGWVPRTWGQLSEQLIARGARFRHDGQQGPRGWITIAEREGNSEGSEFCLG